jgi:hypothetical protein
VPGSAGFLLSRRVLCGCFDGLRSSSLISEHFVGVGRRGASSSSPEDNLADQAAAGNVQVGQGLIEVFHVYDRSFGFRVSSFKC